MSHEQAGATAAPADQPAEPDGLRATLRLADQLDRRVPAANPILSCPTDCARCCHQQLFISEDEWAQALRHLHAHVDLGERRRIVQAARRLVDRRRGLLRHALRAGDARAISDAVDAIDARRTVRCALLTDDNRCSVYTARPLICRVYGRVMRDARRPMLCQVFIDRLNTAKMGPDELRLPQFGAMRAAYLRAGDADLRYSLLPVFVVWHAEASGDLRHEPRPLPRDGSLLALTRTEMADV